MQVSEQSQGYLSATFINFGYVQSSVFFIYFENVFATQLAFTCSKLTVETLEQGVKYVQS